MVSAAINLPRAWGPSKEVSVERPVSPARQRVLKGLMDLLPALMAYVRPRLPDSVEPDDILQDMAARVMAMGEMELEGVENLSGYLFTMAGNMIKDRLRQGQVRAHRAHIPIYDLGLQDSAPSPEDRVEARFRLDRLNRSLDSLPDDMREAFILYKIKGQTLNETAEAMGVPVYKVRKNLERALSRLSRKVWSD